MEGENKFRNAFTITGTEFNKSLKLLRHAFPRKKDHKYVTAVFTAADNEVLISMPGAQVKLNTIGYGNFSCEVPFNLFKSICGDVCANKQLYTFVFDHGVICVNGVSSRSQSIIFRDHAAELSSKTAACASPEDAANEHNVISAAITDDQVSCLGLPLLGIYYQLKQYPPGTLTNPRFLKGDRDIEDILNKVDKLLKPLGLGRDEIEKLLNDRNPSRPANKPSAPPEKRIPKYRYTKADLWAIAFERAYSNYFRVVDDAGNAVKHRYVDFDFDSLSPAELDMYDEIYDDVDQYCKDLYEKETGEKYE